MIPVRFDGFSPILRLETFEIHNVVLHVSNIDLTRNLLLNLLAELCGAPLKRAKSCRRKPAAFAVPCEKLSGYTLLRVEQTAGGKRGGCAV